MDRSERERRARLRYRTVLEAVDHLDDSGADYAIKLLAELREHVEREFVRTDWETYRARQLLDMLKETTDDFRERYWGELQVWQRQAWALGLQPFEELAVGVSFAGLGRRQFEVAAQNGLYYLTDLTDDLRKALSRQVLLTTTGLKTPTEAMQEVKDLLGDGHKAAARAQAIVRTEVGRNYSMATQIGLEDSAVLVPGLQKMWLHSPLGSSKYPRHSHVAMSGVAIPVEENFYFPGGALRYPCDPNGAASEVVNCKCRVTAWHPDWGEI